MPPTVNTALPFTLQIPVYNETKALAFSCCYFDRLGICPRYVLDQQCTSSAEAMLRKYVPEPAFFKNDKPFIEHGYQSFAESAPTDWILRLDCDEVPSPALFGAASEFVRNVEHGILGFQRHQVVWDGSRFKSAITDRFLASRQIQYRLFNRRTVKFNPHIHTPGIHLEHIAVAPPEAMLFHLSWVFLTREEREQKAARYDEQGQPALNRANQLFPLDQVEWRDLDAPLLQQAYKDWLAEDK
jgi:hypothetical protein